MNYCRNEEKQFHIGEKPFFSIFLQIKSGYEERFYSYLIDKIINIKFGDNVLNPNHMKLLKCFGHFDIAIVFNLEKLDLNIDSFEKITHDIAKINYITDSNYIVGYSWDCDLNFNAK